MLQESTCPCAANNLTVAYRDRVVLHDVSIEVPSGAVMGILGPNGAGKSTLLKAIMGLVPCLDGQSIFFGSSLNQSRRRVGYMPQAAEVDWDFPTTVLDVVTMGTYGSLGWWRRPGQKERQRAIDALDQVGIADLADRQISELSGGQKQRTFVARILAQDPDLFFMDEPFAGVDVVSERAIRKVLTQLREAGKTIVIVHHDLSTVREFCTHVTLLNQGRVVASGPLETAFTTEIVQEAYGFKPDMITSTPTPDEGS
ncbi:ABC transporter ATP-binding protein [Stomatohabitans albus]|uniref:metal ABC transporter ATP-binding protein n=1 Tax=Stomatohabitans albus TaxID=3110766 RepID=UPI00300CA936